MLTILNADDDSKLSTRLFLFQCVDVDGPHSNMTEVTMQRGLPIHRSKSFVLGHSKCRVWEVDVWRRVDFGVVFDEVIADVLRTKAADKSSDIRRHFSIQGPLDWGDEGVDKVELHCAKMC